MSTKSTQPLRHVALLRAINVGGKNLLPMKALCALFEAAGCTDVQSYLQSGNVVFCAPPALCARLQATLGEAIEAQFGFLPPIVLRTREELRDAVARNPFLAENAATETLHLAFLESVPTPQRAATLDPKRSPPDAFALLGRDLYLSLPSGVGKTKLTNAYLDRTLGTTSTLRGWRTVLALRDLL